MSDQSTEFKDATGRLTPEGIEAVRAAWGDPNATARSVADRFNITPPTATRYRPGDEEPPKESPDEPADTGDVSSPVDREEQLESLQGQVQNLEARKASVDELVVDFCLEIRRLRELLADAGIDF